MYVIIVIIELINQHLGINGASLNMLRNSDPPNQSRWPTDGQILKLWMYGQYGWFDGLTDIQRMNEIRMDRWTDGLVEGQILEGWMR